MRSRAAKMCRSVVEPEATLSIVMRGCRALLAGKGLRACLVKGEHKIDRLGCAWRLLPAHGEVGSNQPNFRNCPSSLLRLIKKSEKHC